MEKRKIIVTGASGFIGSRTLKHLLDRNFDVYAISSSSFGYDICPYVKWINTDLFLKENVDKIFTVIKPSHLLHLAWYTDHKTYLNSPLNKDWFNNSCYILRKFIENGGKRVVFSGSMIEKYESFYPIYKNTKYCLYKQRLHHYFDMKCKNNKLVSGAWGMPFHIYGPGDFQTKAIPNVIKNIYQHKRCEVKHPNLLFNYLHVQDVARAFVYILDSDVQGEVNICDNKPVIVYDIVNKIKNIIDNGAEINYLGVTDNTDLNVKLLQEKNDILRSTRWTKKIDLDYGLRKTVDYYINGGVNVGNSKT